MTDKPPNPLSGVEPWDLVASGYAAEAPPIMTPFSERALEIARLDRQSVVLDVATGPGTLALLAAPLAKRVCAVDFAPAMLEQLRRALTASRTRNVEVRVGDGQALEFPEATFDATFSMFGLMFFPDRLRGFREMLRVLKPGGVRRRRGLELGADRRVTADDADVRRDSRRRSEPLRPAEGHVESGE
jgi:ubiquinone/menaquinone biosynthesis C-methylase UbiE